MLWTFGRVVSTGRCRGLLSSKDVTAGCQARYKQRDDDLAVQWRVNVVGLIRSPGSTLHMIYIQTSLLHSSRHEALICLLNHTLLLARL